MRDLVLTAFAGYVLVLALRNPLYGLLGWVWMSLMNPHRLTWGFAYSLPFAQLMALALFVSLLIHANKRRKFPVNGVTMTMIVFVFWLCVSPVFSFRPDAEYSFWIRAMKIQAMVLITFLVVGDREGLHKLALVLAYSIAFFGIKGGVYTILTAGSGRVWGPQGSFIGDNNTLALALIMAIPLIRYAHLQEKNIWLRRAHLATMLLCLVSAVGSQSRGAFLAILAMSFFLWLKSRNKALVGILVVGALPIVFLMMPESWYSRMSTIQTYDADASAMGRINAWHMAWNLALDRFPIGGGFTVANPLTFALYAPDASEVLTAHSIYFQILGEHGFMGLFLFLTIFLGAWGCGSTVARLTKGRADLTWARDLASMCQVSLIGYAAGGAFLSLSYYDFPYYVVAILVITRQVVRATIRETAAVPQRPPGAHAAPLATARSGGPVP